MSKKKERAAMKYRERGRRSRIRKNGKKKTKGKRVKWNKHPNGRDNINNSREGERILRKTANMKIKEKMNL